MHDSIAKTGVPIGGRVKCLGVIKDGSCDDRGMAPRFVQGRTYAVVDHCGVACARGGTDYAKTKTDPGWSIPWRGYGYHWEAA
jgi:hypothetical protein